MANNEKLSGVPSLKWYKALITVIIPLGLLMDMMFVGMYILNTMGAGGLLPPPSPMGFFFVFMTAFFIFYRLIVAVTLTGRISAGPKVLVAMYIAQVVYMALYMLFILSEGVSYFALITIFVTMVARIALIPINIVYFVKRRRVFCK